MVPIKSKALQHCEGEMVVEAVDPVENLQDDDLVEHIIQLRARGDNARVIEISGSYVAKHYGKDKIEDVVQAIAKAEALDVRVPHIKRVAKGDGHFECIQERIYGRTLMDAWTDIGWFSTFRLAFQLRGMLRRMRAATSQTAGSLGTGLCRSMWLDDRFGVPPRALPSTISSIINFWHNLVSFRREAGKSPEEHRRSCAGPTQPEDSLVFTHHDLAPRNIILESTTRNLVLVDWDDAGWYPRYFEFAGMSNFIFPKEWGRFDRLRWNLFTWITTGLYRRECRMLTEVHRKLIRFPVARRFNIMAGATLSVRPAEDCS
ncbi:hypothetical protein V493_08312 [Pseudogymnoascus sp. VKM F-4281 (FW-2241)]|nr:hypothetical protein V493_08312 [Pseudogymnoascus sp. VKM F-4281 (FW-2241)]